MQQVKRNSLVNFILGIIAPVTIIVLWQIGSGNGKISVAVLPSPIKLVETFGSLIRTGKLWSELLVSIVRVLKGFGMGACLGIIIGILMGLFPNLNRVLSSLVSIFRPIPMIAWVPILILWTGIGEMSKVMVIAIGAFWPILLNTIHGIVTVDARYLEVADILEKNKWKKMSKIILPSALPSIFTGLKLGISTSWSCVVAAEMIAASKGIGFMISYSREMGQANNMYAGIITISVVGVLIDAVIKRMQKKVLKWEYLDNATGRK